jgi:muconolactone delta-isomerase
MLFHVRMNVNLPPAMPPEQAGKLKQDEKQLAQRLQDQGKWRHLWRAELRAKETSRSGCIAITRSTSEHAPS